MTPTSVYNNLYVNIKKDRFIFFFSNTSVPIEPVSKWKFDDLIFGLMITIVHVTMLCYITAKLLKIKTITTNAKNKIWIFDCLEICQISVEVRLLNEFQQVNIQFKLENIFYILINFPDCTPLFIDKIFKFKTN